MVEPCRVHIFVGGIVAGNDGKTAGEWSPQCMGKYLYLGLSRCTMEDAWVGSFQEERISEVSFGVHLGGVHSGGVHLGVVHLGEVYLAGVHLEARTP